MSRRTTRAAEAAAAQASEAARTLAARSHEARQQPEDAEPPAERTEGSTSPDRVEKLLKARPQSQAMDEIIKKRGLDEPEETKETAQEAPVEAKAEPEVKPESEAAPAVDPAPEAPKTVRVKVDGEEFDAPSEEVEAAGGVKAYQISKANENRLAKTNAALEETRKAQAQIAEFLQRQVQSNQKPELSDAQFIAERLDKWRFGSPEEAAQAQLEIMQRINKPLDQNEIIEKAAAKIRRDQAVESFKSEFPEIMSNPVLLRAAVAIEQEEFAKAPKGQMVDFVALYKKIGNQIRSAVGGQSQPAPKTEKPADNPSPAAVKEARKASIVNLPTAAARAELPKEDKELTPEEERRATIAAMKKARGQ